MKKWFNVIGIGIYFAQFFLFIYWTNNWTNSNLITEDFPKVLIVVCSKLCLITVIYHEQLLSTEFNYIHFILKTFTLIGILLIFTQKTPLCIVYTYMRKNIYRKSFGHTSFQILFLQATLQFYKKGIYSKQNWKAQIFLLPTTDSFPFVSFKFIFPNSSLDTVKLSMVLFTILQRVHRLYPLFLCIEFKKEFRGKSTTVHTELNQS